MKTLYLVGGTMGVGKTIVCQELKSILPRSAFLDGDWCWDMNPFVVNGETKAMVLENIRTLLGNFLKCSAFDHVIFCWVLHQQSIIDAILEGLELSDVRVIPVSLVCTREILLQRLYRDVEAGRRQPDILLRSPQRLSLYDSLPTVKIDTSALDVGQAARAIAALGREPQ